MTDETAIAKALVDGVLPLLYMTDALRGRDEVRTKLEGWIACVVRDARNEGVDAAISVAEKWCNDSHVLARLDDLRTTQSESKDPP